MEPNTTTGTATPLAPPARALVLVEILTVGLPFCVFKLACGLPLTATSSLGLRLLGWGLVGVGGVDTLLNVLSAIWVGIAGRRKLPVCCLQALTLAVRPSVRGGNVGTALDMMLSFSLVAWMIGSGALGTLTPGWLSSWNLAVVLNVLGAGALRLAEVLIPPPAQK